MYLQVPASTASGMESLLFAIVVCCKGRIWTCRYAGYDDAYNDASSSLAEQADRVSSPSGSSKGLVVGSHVIGTHRHRDVWNQQIKESNEKAKTQIKHGFKVCICVACC